MRYWWQILLCIPLAGWAQNGPYPKEAIKEVIKEAYVDGVFNEGNLRNIDLGFAQEFTMIGLDQNDSLRKASLEDWKTAVQRKQEASLFPPDKSKEVSVKYESIDLEDRFAMVKLKFYVGKDWRYTDYLTLVKLPTGWKILNKTFREMPENPEGR